MAWKHTNQQWKVTLKNDIYISILKLIGGIEEEEPGQDKPVKSVLTESQGMRDGEDSSPDKNTDYSLDELDYSDDLSLDKDPETTNDEALSVHHEDMLELNGDLLDLPVNTKVRHF